MMQAQHAKFQLGRLQTMPVDAQDMFDAVVAQRNGAMDGLVQAHATIAAKDRRIAELEAELAALKEAPKE